MTIRINIKSTELETKNGTSKASGKAYSIREQTGYAMMGEEIRKVTISLERDQGYYPVGLYELLDSSFTTNNFGQLVVGRLHLKPLAAAAAKVA